MNIILFLLVGAIILVILLGSILLLVKKIKTPTATKDSSAVSKNSACSQEEESSLGVFGKVFVAIFWCIVATLVAFLTSHYGSILIKDYNLPSFLNGIIIFITALGAAVAIGQAIKPVFPKPTHVPVALAALILIFIFQILIGSIDYFRTDNFDPKTGKAKILISEKSGKIWHDKDYAKFKFDPETGEKIIVPTPEKLKELKEETFLKNNPKQETSDTIHLELNKLYVSPAFKKGEMSNFWIVGPPGAPTHRHIGRRGKKHLALLLDNGKVYNYTQGELPPKNVHYKFKFIALEDGAIGLAKYTRD